MQRIPGYWLKGVLVNSDSWVFFPQVGLEECRNSCFSVNGCNFSEFELLMHSEFSVLIVIRLSPHIFNRKYLSLFLFHCRL